MREAVESVWTYPSADGSHTITASVWTPAQGKVRAVIQICHGMEEHILRYRWLAGKLCERGFAVCGDDHLGHGRSASGPEELGYFGDRGGDAYLVEDEHRLRQEMQRRYPDKPYFLLGHSMGSFITRRYVAAYGEGLAGYICCGTSGRNPAVKIAIGLSTLLIALRGSRRKGRLLQRLAFSAYNRRYETVVTGYEWLTRDPAVYERDKEDPACFFGFTNAGFRDLFRLLDSVTGPKWSDRVPKALPIALFSGDMDPVGQYGKGVKQVYAWLKGSGVEDVSITLYPGARHELHNESNREEFVGDLIGWMESRMPDGEAAL